MSIPPVYLTRGSEHINNERDKWYKSMETTDKKEEFKENESKTQQRTDKKLKFYKKLSMYLGVILGLGVLGECGGCMGIGGRWGRYNDATQGYVERIDEAITDAVREKEVVDGMKVGETRTHGLDSIGIFVKDGKYGYYNLNTDKVTIPATYTHAWFFSEGLAAVERDGKIGFVDMSGKVVIPLQFIYRTNASSGIAFCNKRCVMANGNGQVGVIDPKGAWVVEPVYDEVTLTESCIYVATSSTRFQLNHDGEVMQKDMIVRVEPLKCAEDSTGYYVYYVREGKNGSRCGVMDATGLRLTEPVYSRIEALGQDLFGCYLLDDVTMEVKHF